MIPSSCNFTTLVVILLSMMKDRFWCIHVRYLLHQSSKLDFLHSFKLKQHILAIKYLCFSAQKNSHSDIISASHDFRHLLSNLLMFLGSPYGKQYGPRSVGKKLKSRSKENHSSSEETLLTLL